MESRYRVKYEKKSRSLFIKSSISLSRGSLNPVSGVSPKAERNIISYLYFAYFSNFSQKVTRSLCHGIAQNLAEMMSPEMLKESGKTRIIGSGACLCRNPVLMEEVQNVYDMPVEFTSEGSACIGAALAMIDVLEK